MRRSTVFIIFGGFIVLLTLNCLQAFEFSEYPLDSVQLKHLAKRSSYGGTPVTPTKPPPEVGLACCKTENNSGCGLHPVNRCPATMNRTNIAAFCNFKVVGEDGYCNHCGAPIKVPERPGCTLHTGPSCICERRANGSVWVRFHHTVASCIFHTCKQQLPQEERHKKTLNKPRPDWCVDYKYCEEKGATSNEAGWKEHKTLKCPY